MAISKIDASTVKFVGQSDIVIFPAVANYDTAKLSDILTGGQSLGQIDGDSTEWNGEEASMENRVDEQGDIITTTTKKGTLAFTCRVASTSQKMMQLFLKGQKVDVPTGATTFGDLKNVTEITKLGVDLPVMTRPIAIINDEANRMIIFPKAKILADPKIENKMLTINLKVTAEYVDSQWFGPCIIVDGTPSYAAAAAPTAG